MNELQKPVNFEVVILLCEQMEGVDQGEIL